MALQLAFNLDYDFWFLVFLPQLLKIWDIHHLICLNLNITYKHSHFTFKFFGFMIYIIICIPWIMVET